VPAVVSYDPAFAFELALIVRDGIRRMYELEQPIMYYLTVYNENLPMPAMPEGVEEGVLKGLYRFRSSALENPRARVQLLGSGSLMGEVLKAQERLADAGIAADVWSVTSYVELYREAREADRQSQLEPASPTKAYVTAMLEDAGGPFIAVTDYMCSLPESISKWIPGWLVTLGTDGFGLSETRQSLREHFRVDADHIVSAALNALGDTE
jgi:pyruvate dehydrogenase E1 component